MTPRVRPFSRDISSRSALFGMAVLAGALAFAPAVAQPSQHQVIAPLVQGDEPIVVTEHTVQTARGPLTYEARVGRLAIRDAQTGQTRGHMFFVAYVVKGQGSGRPITFAWNGGPGAPSSIIHMEGLGPRRALDGRVVDNAETLLQTSDLVFMDAMGVGFSRLEDPRFAPEFYNLRGDIAATTEFIRAYRTRFRTAAQPTFIAGESYGVFRAAGVADEMTDRGDKLSGVILVSGDIPNIPQTVAFYDAMHVPARTATACVYKRLPPDMPRDCDAAAKQAFDWAVKVYEPALKRLDSLTPAEKDRIAAELARYIGMRPDQVDHKTLVVHANRYVADFMGGDGERTLDGHDMRNLEGDPSKIYGDPALVTGYLRNELGYDTDLAYIEPEHGYAPTPGPKVVPAGYQFTYDLLGPTEEAISEQAGEVTWTARAMPPYIPSALGRDKQLRVFVSTGRYDPLNMCEGDVRVTAQLPPDEARRIENVCYPSGHVVYRDPVARTRWLADIARFEATTLAAQAQAARDKPKTPQDGQAQ